MFTWALSLLVCAVFMCSQHSANGAESSLPIFKYFDGVINQPTLNSLGLPETTYLKTGTTIVGICCRDGIVLGADTRSTGGPLVMDKNKRKIHPIAHSIFSCAAGTSADCDQITRKAAQYLSMVRIEKELAGEANTMGRMADSVRTAVTHISNTIRNRSVVSQNGRKVQAVLILGGVDTTGPSLYQIDAEGVPIRVSFGALGSGSTDALAVLESARREWTRRPSEPSSGSRWTENVSVEEATAVVRRAVQSGILNDLGSGSHVDLCVITEKEVKLWRESLVCSWDADRISVSKYTESSGLDCDARHSGSQSGVPEAALGKKIHSALRPRRRLNVDGQVQEVAEASPLDGMLGLNIDLIE